jgi:hypothetical protein
MYCGTRAHRIRLEEKIEDGIGMSVAAGRP